MKSILLPDDWGEGRIIPSIVSWSYHFTDDVQEKGCLSPWLMVSPSPDKNQPSLLVPKHSNITIYCDGYGPFLHNPCMKNPRYLILDDGIPKVKITAYVMTFETIYTYSFYHDDDDYHRVKSLLKTIFPLDIHHHIRSFLLE
jgi:hypothetical protein